VFDARAMAYETEELWFDEWEHGGKAYYEDPRRIREMEPGQFRAELADTDAGDHRRARLPHSLHQGLAAFTALQRRGIPSRLLVNPSESHWVLKPKNSRQWYHEVLGWMNRWTGKGGQ